jgi:2-polyprenyl-3-methyl-5-hydroxy-6-metoxy-1,4-benzoquinol methylase
MKNNAYRFINFSKKINKLFLTEKYFVKIEPAYAVNYEENYHRIAIDPDGNKRFLHKERDLFLKNNIHIIKYLRRQKPGKILDLGCGNGSLSNVISECGYEVFGMEESPSGVTIASKNFPNCQFIQGSIYNSPPPDLENAFDVVISVEVIEHLFYPSELVRLARKCLKPGGYLILTTPYHGSFKNLALALSGKMDKHFTVLWDGGHIKFFSVETLTKLLETEGYTEIGRAHV